MVDTLSSSFREFVQQATPPLQSREASTGSASIAEFEKFAVEAAILLFRDAADYVAWLSVAIVPLEPSLLAHDVLAVSGIAGDENRYTELLAWALWPPNDSGLAGACQRAWIRYSTGLQPIRPVQPRTQFYTDDGVPDLVLAYDERPTVVEAKTRSNEHETPRTRRMQTIAYPPAVRRALGLAEEGPSEMVFLTVDRSPPANGLAHAISYLETALVIAGVIEAAQMSEELRAAYRIVLGHLARRAVPDDLDIHEVLVAVRAWRTAENADTPVIARFAKVLARCEQVLPARRPA